ncbi:hypothetical protein N44_02026 [Microcystis aeruginosa NIES-44]|uniref:Uncharacterized protein n=1 Tax=Microcystis aeruginosa NIES-44 TaxID=449439 RepID=A0A0A1VUT1_MICAE|nr:hypothetical protein N44_02026 [Microcystis aeruginosa NIES-44]
MFNSLTIDTFEEIFDGWNRKTPSLTIYNSFKYVICFINEILNRNSLIDAITSFNDDFREIFF